MHINAGAVNFSRDLYSFKYWLGPLELEILDY